MSAAPGGRRRAAGVPAVRAALATLLALLAAGCVSETVADSAQDVLTLKTGTVNELRALRGTGPMTRYALAPAEMLEVAAQACRRMVGLRGTPVTGVEVSPRYGEVVAKERAPGAPADPGYSYEWRSAGVITVHAVPGEPGSSDVEVHGTRRSLLQGCAVDWERMLPPVLAELAARRREAGATPAR